MFKTLTIALASAAVIGTQAMAVIMDYESGTAFSTYADNELINTEETILRATDGTTMVLDAKTYFKGTLNIQGTVTLSIPEYCAYDSHGEPEADGYMLKATSFTFGKDAHLLVDLSDATLDVIMTSYEDYDGDFGAQVILLGGKRDDLSHVTLSDATVARFAQRGIEIISTTDFVEAIADGKGALIDDTVVFGKQGTPIVAPEPATATLSLLALAALAARRKRH